MSGGPVVLDPESFVAKFHSRRINGALLDRPPALSAIWRFWPHLLLCFPCCSLDASACALLSEDYRGTTRFHFQSELCLCQTAACLVPLPATSGARPRPTCFKPSQEVVLIASSGGKASVALHPTCESAALQQALAGLQPTGEANLEAALKLALVGAASRCIGVVTYDGLYILCVFSCSHRFATGT